MANTYTQLYFHIVIIVKGRNNLISRKWKEELYSYITGIVKNKNQKLFIINGMPNHVHLLIGTKPDCNLSDLMRLIKSSSSKWINEKGFIKEKFNWQSGFSAFSKNHSNISVVVNYIKNQERHHQKTSLKEEYVGFLLENNVEFKEKYLFD